MDLTYPEQLKILILIFKGSLENKNKNKNKAKTNKKQQQKIKTKQTNKQTNKNLSDQIQIEYLYSNFKSTICIFLNIDFGITILKGTCKFDVVIIE